jgi:hypothetical protein
MTFRNYITLDGKKFRTQQKAWTPVDTQPGTARRTLADETDITFGSSAYLTWMGEVEAPVALTPAEIAAGWGTYADLISIRHRKALVPFEDHYGASYAVGIFGSFPDRSFLPVWDDPTNVIFVPVKLVEA